MDVLTLVHGRADHLANLILGLERSALVPEHLIIVQMNQPLRQWHSAVFPVVNVPLHTANEALPLAKARNLAVASSVAEHLVFLDVDCIPSHRLLSVYDGHLAQERKTVIQGSVKYLPPADLHHWDEKLLESLGTAHPAFNDYAFGSVLPHELFWSLNFGCCRETFDLIGGFDEAYTGYGGEDTDFSFRAKDKGTSIKLAQAVAFHQYHVSQDPPVNHLASIVRNANIFHDRWGWWPMIGWLDAFEASGFIAIRNGRIDILRMPTANMVEPAVREPAK